MSATLQNAIFKGRYKEALTRYLELEKSILQCLATVDNNDNNNNMMLQYNYFPDAEQEIDRQQLTVSQVILHNLVRLATTNSKSHAAAATIKFSIHEKNLDTTTDFITLENYIKSNETTILPPNISHVLKTSHRIASDIIEKNNLSASSISNFENACRYFDYLGLKLQEYCINDISRWSRLSSKLFKYLYELTKEYANLHKEKQQWMVETENYVNKHKTLMEKLCQQRLEKINTDNDRLRQYIIQLETKMKTSNDISNTRDVEMSSVISDSLPQHRHNHNNNNKPTIITSPSLLQQQQPQPEFDNNEFNTDNMNVNIPKHIYDYLTEIEKLIHVITLYRILIPLNNFSSWDEEIQILEQQIQQRQLQQQQQQQQQQRQ